jgi:hypothetical protein
VQGQLCVLKKFSQNCISHPIFLKKGCFNDNSTRNIIAILHEKLANQIGVLVLVGTNGEWQRWPPMARVLLQKYSPFPEKIGTCTQYLSGGGGRDGWTSKFFAKSLKTKVVFLFEVLFQPNWTKNKEITGRAKNT